MKEVEVAKGDHPEANICEHKGKPHFAIRTAFVSKYFVLFIHLLKLLLVQTSRCADHADLAHQLDLVVHKELGHFERSYDVLVYKGSLNAPVKHLVDHLEKVAVNQQVFRITAIVRYYFAYNRHCDGKHRRNGEE